MARAGRKDRGLLSKKDSTGKLMWYVRLYDNGKERRFGAFKNKTEARDFYEKAKQEQKQGQFFPERYQHGGKEFASAVIASYLATLPTSGKKPTTIADERFYAKWWTDRLDGKALHAVTPALLDQAMADLAAKHYAPQTIVHYLKFLRHVFRWAIGRSLIEKSPFASVKLPTVRAGKTRFLSIEEETKLCQAIGQPYDAWVRLAILTGLRKSEQFGLRWADIDLERGLITLPDTKSGAVQYVHLMEEAKAILSRLIPGNTSVWVFPSENPETHLDPDNFYGRLYLPALEGATLEGVTWHTLRHTFASRLAMNGQSPSTIAALLRHSGTDLVARYAHLSPTHLHGALEGVSGFGKVKDETSQARVQPRQERQNSNPTVTGTGTEHAEGESEEAQGVESIGRGERI
ncbi:MAG: site-specific integrase [Nitrospiraceae bacterium]